MKTAIIWEEIEEEVQFFVEDGDLSRFDKLMLNSSEDTEEFSDYFYSEGGKLKPSPVTRDEFRAALLDPTTILINCGFCL